MRKSDFNSIDDVTVQKCISLAELIESRKQEMEDYMLPNQQTQLTVKGKTVTVYSKEV